MPIALSVLLCACGNTASTEEATCDRPEWGETMLVDEWAFVPSGSFTTGPFGEESDPEDVRDVTISRGFWMQTTELSESEYARILTERRAIISDDETYAAFASNQKRVWALEYDVGYARRANFGSAINMANERSFLEGRQICYPTDGCVIPGPEQLTPTLAPAFGGACAAWAVAHEVPNCTGYRLATEMEWEWAARAAGRETCMDGGSCLDSRAWHYDHYTNDRSVHSGAHRSALLCPNALGIYDLFGNMFEWTSDMRSRDAGYAYETDGIDPRRPLPEEVFWNDRVPYLVDSEGNSEETFYLAVVRGGNFFTPPEEITPFTHHYQWMSDYFGYGIRLVRTATAEEEEAWHAQNPGWR